MSSSLRTGAAPLRRSPTEGPTRRTCWSRCPRQASLACAKSQSPSACAGRVGAPGGTSIPTARPRCATSPRRTVSTPTRPKRPSLCSFTATASCRTLSARPGDLTAWPPPSPASCTSTCLAATSCAQPATTARASLSTARWQSTMAAFTAPARGAPTSFSARASTTCAPSSLRMGGVPTSWYAIRALTPSTASCTCPPPPLARPPNL
mmetsp:Transcript_32960/g.84466  ORF Transcript_32960/g.84466 Transcript_32960/m.84466 type:complete len:207 (+) Transcript_32960:484-1104(+)